MEAIENYNDQQFFDIYGFHETITFEKDKAFPLIPGVTEPVVFPKGTTTTTKLNRELEMHVVLTPFEKQYWKTILDFVRVPTIYLTPSGPITIDYDKDRLSYLQFEDVGYNDDIEGFREYVDNNMTVFERVLFVQHCTF